MSNSTHVRRHELARADAPLLAAEAEAHQNPAFRLDVRRSLRMHPVLAASVAGAVFLLLVLWALTRPSVYTAESLVYVEPAEVKVLNDGSSSGYDPSRYDSYLQQQVQTIQRADTLEAALAKMPPGVWSYPGESTASAVRRLAAALKTPERVLNSYQLAIDVSASNPEAAAAAANAITSAYLELGRKDEHMRSDQRLQLLTEERERITDEMTRDKAEQAALGTSLGVADPNGAAGNPYDVQTTGLRSQLAAAQEARDAVSAQLASVSGVGLETAANELIVTDPGLVTIRQTLSQRRAVLADQMAGLTAANPVYKQDQEEIAQIDRATERATEDARARAERQLQEKLRLDLRRTADVEQRLNGQLAEQTAKATGAGPKLQRAAELQTDLQRLNARYATVDDAIRGLQLETGGPGQAHLALAASVPDAPQPSRKKLVLLLALPLSLLCGVAAAVIARKRDPRLYLPGDLQEVLGFAPMCTLPPAGDVSPGAYDEFLLRLAGGLEGAYRHGGARSFVFTPVSVDARADDLLAHLCEKLRQIGYRAERMLASELLPSGGALRRPSRDGVAGELERTGVSEGAAATQLGRLLLEFDIVLIQAPPLLRSALTEYAVRCADATILLIESGRTERTELRRAALLLERLNPQGIGAVLEDMPVRQGDAVFRASVRAAGMASGWATAVRSGKQETGSRKQEARNREQEAGNREQGTGNREQGTGNREQGDAHARVQTVPQTFDSAEDAETTAKVEASTPLSSYAEPVATSEAPFVAAEAQAAEGLVSPVLHEGLEHTEPVKAPVPEAVQPVPLAIEPIIFREARQKTAPFLIEEVSGSVAKADEEKPVSQQGPEASAVMEVSSEMEKPSSMFRAWEQTETPLRSESEAPLLTTSETSQVEKAIAADTVVPMWTAREQAGEVVAPTVVAPPLEERASATTQPEMARGAEAPTQKPNVAPPSFSEARNAKENKPLAWLRRMLRLDEEPAPRIIPEDDEEDDIQPAVVAAPQPTFVQTVPGNVEGSKDVPGEEASAQPAHAVTASPELAFIEAAPDLAGERWMSTSSVAETVDAPEVLAPLPNAELEDNQPVAWEREFTEAAAPAYEDAADAVEVLEVAPVMTPVFSVPSPAVEAIPAAASATPQLEHAEETVSEETRPLHPKAASGADAAVTALPSGAVKESPDALVPSAARVAIEPLRRSFAPARQKELPRVGLPRHRRTSPITVSRIPSLVTSVVNEQLREDAAPARKTLPLEGMKEAQAAQPAASAPDQPPAQRTGLAKAARVSAAEAPPARASEGLAAMRLGAGLRKATARQESASRLHTPMPDAQLGSQNGEAAVSRRWAMLSRFERVDDAEGEASARTVGPVGSVHV